MIDKISKLKPKKLSKGARTHARRLKQDARNNKIEMTVKK